jgi:hypothetical protein
LLHGGERLALPAGRPPRVVVVVVAFLPSFTRAGLPGTMLKRQNRIRITPNTIGMV